MPLKISLIAATCIEKLARNLNSHNEGTIDLQNIIDIIQGGLAKCRQKFMLIINKFSNN